MKKIKTAYSLIELSIVILIISILITGALSVSVSSINNAKIKVTNDRIKEIYNALGGYLLAYGKLPCPADITQLKSTSSSYGSASGVDGTCTGTGVYLASGLQVVYGMVPVKNLGLSSDMAEDGFETKIAYIVDKRLTSTTTFNQNFAQGTPTPAGYMTIRELRDPNPPAVFFEFTVDFALISYGANKAGGFGINSSAQATRSTDTYEMENDLNVAGGNLFNEWLYSSTNTDLFDDIVFGKSRVNMINDFRAYNSIKCISPGGSFPTGNYNYGQMLYASTACVNVPSTRLTKRCDTYGQFFDVVSVCP
jgi:prepilin-type N-terminal cleavage/methylation domain-containing protein